MVGKVIERIRKYRNISISELSRRCKLNRGALWKIETGRSDPKSETLKVIAAALNVDPAIFFDNSVYLNQQLAIDERKAM